MKNLINTSIVLMVITLLGCNKEFLDSKPNSNIIQPSTIEDCKALLENYIVSSSTGALPVLASDEYYYLDAAGWQAASTATERQSYIWAKDVYGGEVNIQDWNAPYQAIFYANNVLASLSQMSDSLGSADYSYVKGWAYFVRAYELFDLLRNYGPAYDSTTAATALGIPLKLKGGIDNVEQRASIEKSFEQIFSDLDTAGKLLTPTYQEGHQNRPSKVSVYGLMARIYLYMRHYKDAMNYADSSLKLYSYLLDYNDLDASNPFPFASTNKESIYTTSSIQTYLMSIVAYNVGQNISIDTTLLALYDDNDLRRKILLQKVDDKQIIPNGNYYGIGLYPYTGLAVDEMYLIRAECLARLGLSQAALDDLNTLLSKRYIRGTFHSLTTGNSGVVLERILEERRKELVWRGLRWSDLKRLNMEGANITLTRILNGLTYTLMPNDPRYVFNIPADEIGLSNIAQNER